MPTIARDALATHRLGLAELRSGHDRIVAIAQFLGVLVDVESAMRQRQLVVHDRGQRAERLG